MTERARRAWGEWWLAATFLTTLPAPRFTPPATGLGPAGRWFPLVGLLIGVILWGVAAAASQVFAPLLTAALVMTAWVALTGALHLDGLADCCDGLLPPVARERRPVIMADPRLGAFGGAGLLLTLLLKVAALTSLVMAAPVALILAPVWARLLLLLAARAPLARAEGMAAAFAAGITPRTLAWAALLPLLLLPWGGAQGLLAATAGLLVTWGAVRLAQARLGGITGDVLGLVVEAGEVTMLLVFAAQAQP